MELLTRDFSFSFVLVWRAISDSSPLLLGCSNSSCDLFSSLPPRHPCSFAEISRTVSQSAQSRYRRENHAESIKEQLIDMSGETGGESLMKQPIKYPIPTAQG